MATTTAEAVRTYRGPALFSFGFRPFFLFSAVWSALAVPIWIAALLFGDGRIGGHDGRAWHVHEMLFGFLPGVIGGFLLTAVPNWTGRLPVTGTRLVELFALWVAGRIASLAPAPFEPAAAAIDCAFLAVLSGVVWREVLAGKNLRNLPVCALTTLLALADGASWLRDAVPAIGDAPERVALAAAAVMISLIGGRMVPSFTTNWLKARASARLPAPQGSFDQDATAGSAVALAAWAAAPQLPEAGVLLLVAGAVNLIRLARWRGWACGAEALVWILHAGYAWLGLGLAILGASVLWPAAVPRVAAIHALTAGAVGVMTLAVMTRASLGHTGRARVANRATVAIYLLVNAAAAVRVAAVFAGALQPALLEASAALWALAFGGFAMAYGPMLARPRAA
jgi:uncharacterized protein involved in response to NO